MKKAKLILASIFIVLTSLLPIAMLLCAVSGYTFHLSGYYTVAVIIALLSIVNVVLDAVDNQPDDYNVTLVLYTISTPLSLINTTCFIIKEGGMLIVSCMAASVFCSFYLMLSCQKFKAIKIVSIVLSVIMIIPVGFISFISFVMGDFGQNTVVDTVVSPDGSYYIEVVDNDQGALGGSTLVDVYYNKGLCKLGIFKLSQNAYTGRWGEFNNMSVYWIDEDTFFVNSHRFDIK